MPETDSGDSDVPSEILEENRNAVWDYGDGDCSIVDRCALFVAGMASAMVVVSATMSTLVVAPGDGGIVHRRPLTTVVRDWWTCVKPIIVNVILQ